MVSGSGQPMLKAKFEHSTAELLEKKKATTEVIRSISPKKIKEPTTYREAEEQLVSDSEDVACKTLDSQIDDQSLRV